MLFSMGLSSIGVGVDQITPTGTTPAGSSSDFIVRE
jgi:hypothetical protein